MARMALKRRICWASVLFFACVVLLLGVMWTSHVGVILGVGKCPSTDLPELRVELSRTGCLVLVVYYSYIPSNWDPNVWNTPFVDWISYPGGFDLIVAAPVVMPVPGLCGYLCACLCIRKGVRSKRRLVECRCSDCGYDLRAHLLGQKCPECGTVISGTRFAPTNPPKESLPP